MPSDFLKLNWEDFGRGLVVAVLSAVITYLYQAVQTSFTTLDFATLGQVAITALLAYLLKNLTTNSNGDLLKGER